MHWLSGQQDKQITLSEAFHWQFQPSRSHSLNLETLDANAAVDSDGCSGTSLKSGTLELGFPALGIDGSWNDASVSGRAFSVLHVYRRLRLCLDLWHYFKCANAARELLLAWSGWPFCLMQRWCPPCWIVLRTVGYNILKLSNTHRVSKFTWLSFYLCWS